MAHIPPLDMDSHPELQPVFASAAAAMGFVPNSTRTMGTQGYQGTLKGRGVFGSFLRSRKIVIAVGKSMISTHMPFRSWCRHCVKGQGMEESCRRSGREDGGIPEVHLDFMFMGEEEGGKTLAILVGRERWTKATMSTVAPRKSSGEWLARRVRAWMVEVGCAYGDVVVKSDNEPALVALVEALGRERAVKGVGGMAVEHSPVHSSRSNGVVERAVQSVEGQMGVMMLALEGRVGRTVDPEEAIVTFLPEYAAYLLNRLEVGKDGKIAYEGVKGKSAKVVGLEFGEKVLWRKKKGDRMAKQQDKHACA